MERQQTSQEEMERKLRSYLRSEVQGLEPPANLWQRLQPRLRSPRRGWPPGLTGFRLAAAALVSVFVLAILIVAAPFMTNFTGKSISDGAAGEAGLSGQPGNPGAPSGPQGPPGAPGLPPDLLLPREPSRGEGFDSNTSQGFDGRLIVYESSLTLVVEGVGQAIEQVSQAAEDLGGFVVSSSRNGDDSANVTVRVPSEDFDEALESLRVLGTRVVSESIQSEDVTEEYVDLQSRLRNWEAAESQYLELLSRAQTVESTLQVQRELFEVRQEIERLKGRMQYLERTSSMALITVHLRPESDPGPLVQPGWSAAETSRSALRSFVDFGQWLAGVAIWIGVYSPVWLVLGAVAFLALRRFGRR